MQNKRLLDIVGILLRQDKYITINEISKTLQVSNKTIRNDLKLVEAHLQEKQLHLIKKTGVGVSIEGDKKIKLHMIHTILEKQRENIDYSPNARKIFIGMKLILTPQKCRIYELADELYVSRATIHKDVMSLIPLLEEYRITLYRKNNNGLSIEGKERSYRSLLLELMCQDNGFQLFNKMVQNTNFTCDGSFPFPALDYNDDEIQEFLKVLENAQNEFLHHLLFPSLVKLLLHLFISFVRIKENNHVQLSGAFIKELQEKPFYEETKQLTSILEEYYHVSFSEMENRYLQVFLLSLKNSNEISAQEKEEAHILCKQIVQDWQEALSYPFMEDKELLHSMYTHLCPAITRFKHGISIDNPMMHEIHSLYGNTFTLAKQAMHHIEKRFACQVSDEEIGYFALHLAAALDRSKKPLQTILVCHDSIGATNLLKGKLAQQFLELQIVSVESYISIYEHTLENVDLILSTMDLSLSCEIPLLIINSLLHDYDIVRLKTIIATYYKSKNDPLTHV